MKKLLLSMILLGTMVATYSQITIRPGVRGGFNLSTITNTDGDTRTDFYLGALGAVKFADFYTLQPELTYSRQGVNSDVSGEENLEIQYLAISLTNKFFFLRDTGLHAIVGPSFDIKLNDNFSDNFGELSIEAFDFSLIGGLGYEFPMGLTIEGRFKHGFVDIFGSNIGNEISIDEILLNQMFQIGLSYQFDF